MDQIINQLNEEIINEIIEIIDYRLQQFLPAIIIFIIIITIFFWNIISNNAKRNRKIENLKNENINLIQRLYNQEKRIERLENNLINKNTKYGNGFNFETIATIEDAKREAIERHGYNAGGITIADYYSHAEISNADYWSNPYDPKIDDETPLVDYGQNGYLANWIDFE